MDLPRLKLEKKYRDSIFCALFILILFPILFFPLNSFAAESLSYSGRLVKADGSPVAGPVDLKIDLSYTNAPTAVLCSQDFSGVVLSNGVFHLKLDLLCPGPPVKTMTEILTSVPATFAAALRVSDVSNNKTYSFQEIHSMPFANIAETAKQLSQLGAVNGEILKWNDTTKKWEPGNPGGAGTVMSVSTTAPLSVVNGATNPALSIAKANATTDGYLSAVDWNTFNNKLGLLTGGTTLEYYRGDNTLGALNTSVVPESGVTNLYFSNARVLGVALDGFTIGTGAILASDTLLQAFGKTQGQINSLSTDSAKYLIKNGTDIITGAVSVGATGSLKTTNAPAMLTDVTNMAYVDSRDDLKVSKAGDTVSGVLTLNSDLKIKVGASNYVTIKTPASMVADYNLVLPQSAGGPGHFLKTDGVGNLSWVNPSSIAAGPGTVDSASIVDGTIVNVDIANTTIGYAKLNLTDGDIPLAKLNGVSDTTKYLRGDKVWQTLNAAAVINTPSGSIAALTTQAALNELETEKEPSLTAGLSSDYYKGNKSWSNLETDVRASKLTGLVAGTNTAIAATDSILMAFQNTQAQINNKQNLILKTTLQDVSKLRIYGANATNYVELSAATLSANRSLIFPDANGSSGQVLTTDGAGVLSWTSAATMSSVVGGDLTGTIANSQLAAGVVGATELAADAVISAKILDGTIVNADLANTTISYAKLNLIDGDIPLAKLNGVSDATKYLRGDKVWSSFASDAINSVLSTFTVALGSKPAVVNTDTVVGAFGKVQKTLNDINGDYVSKTGNNTVTGSFNISGITAFLNIPTPTGTVLNEAANVDYVKNYVSSMGQWSKNSTDIYFNTGNVGIGTSTPDAKLTVNGAIKSMTGGVTYPDGQTQVKAVNLADHLCPSGFYLRGFDSSGVKVCEPVDQINTEVVYTQVSVNYIVSCAIRLDNVVECWGYNIHGQLGDGLTTTVYKPVVVRKLDGTALRATKISSGGYFNCAIQSSDSKVYCWGYNDYGQLGTGTTTNSSFARPVSGLGPVIDVGAGGMSGCAIDTTNKVWCWGYNINGELGDGTNTNRLIPTATLLGASQLNGVNKIVPSAYSFCAYNSTSGTTTYCWGYNGYGEIGDNTVVSKNKATPINLSSYDANASQIYSMSKSGSRWASYEHTCAVIKTTSNTYKSYCWGRNGEYQLGDGTAIQRNIPTYSSAIGTKTSPFTISAMIFSTCILESNNTASCLGYNNYGQLGNGTTTTTSTLVTMKNYDDSGNLDVASLPQNAGGYYDGTNGALTHYCVLTTTGRVACSGYNGYGNLGNGTATYSTLPVTVLR